MTEQALTFESVLALFMADREQMREFREQSERNERKSDRAFRKMRRAMKESSAEFDRRMAETDQLMERVALKIERIAEENGKLGKRLGELVEAMVEGGIIRMFQDLGYEFDVCDPHRHFGNKEIGYGEVDLFLENGEIALLAEVKTNLSVDDINEHKERLALFRLDANRKNDTRRFIAAVGGGLVRENVRMYALRQGMFVIQQSGENIEIIAPKGKPREW